MAWSYTNADQSIVSDGNESIPLNQPTERSLWMAQQIAGGLAIGPYVPPPTPAPSYDPTQLTQMLVAKGIIPAPST